MKEVSEILKSKHFSGFKGTPAGHNGGWYVQYLEIAFHKRFGVKYAIALNSATAGLHAALIACGIGQGDEVIVSPYSFSSSASCVLMVGAKPVFADIDPETYCIRPMEVARLVTAKTKAIIPVHLFGQPADMDGIMYIAEKYHFRVIEDAAQAITATYKGRYVGTIGDCGVFSFTQGKHISTGEGGMLITNDEGIARKVKAVRNHGEVSDPELAILGYNYRMCEIEAALALNQLEKIDEKIQKRIEKAGDITEKITKYGFAPPKVRKDCKHVFYLYATKVNNGGTVPLGKGWDRGYVRPIYMLPIYRQFGYGEGLCPTTEEVEKQIIIKSML